MAEQTKTRNPSHKDKYYFVPIDQDLSWTPGIYIGDTLSFTTAAESSLVAYYPMNEGQGTIVTDASGNGYDGQAMNGSPTWVEGKEGKAISFTGANTSFINCGTFNPSEGTGQLTVSLWIKFAGDYGGYQGIIAKRNTYSAGQMMWALEAMNTSPNRLSFNLVAQSSRVYSILGLSTGTWDNVTVTYNGATAIIYVNGVENGRADMQFAGGVNTPVLIGCDDASGGNGFNGAIDEVYIFNTALSPSDVIKVMFGVMKPVVDTGTATKPVPGNKSSEISIDIGELSWSPGQYANTHNVFFGTNKANVTNATIADPLGTTVFQGLDINNISIDRLEYNTTYYWRVDEVNSPSNPGTYKGQVWQFTVEPYASKILKENITATAISSFRYRYPNSTINESGLDPNNMDFHSSNNSNMWLSSGHDIEPVWIRFDFDKTYKLYEMFVWNYNGSPTGYGLKSIIIEYTEDGNNWSVLSDVNEFAQAPGTDGYQYNTIADFNGVAAKSVKITALSNWSNGSFGLYGLSEVRFMYIPTLSRTPLPAPGATNVPLDITLSWRPGREVTEHYIYFGTNKQNVIDGNVLPIIVTEPNYGPLSLVLDANYYWRVDEVNDNDAHSIWQGDIWNFTTQKYLIVDDFENYKDTEPNRIFDFYTDGKNDPLNGSIIGYPDPNLSTGEHYMEKSIFHTGFQSAPIIFDNTIASCSEVSIDSNNLDIGSNWIVGSPEFLVLWFYGDPNNSSTERIYVRINGIKILYNGNQADILSTAWKQWNIDLVSSGIDLSNVSSLSLGFEKTEATGGSGIIYIDDIRLYREAP